MKKHLVFWLIVKMSKLYFELIEYLTRLFILLLVIIINSGSPGRNTGQKIPIFGTRPSGGRVSGTNLPCRKRFRE